MHSPDQVLTGDIVCPLIQAKLESTHISADSMALVIDLMGDIVCLFFSDIWPQTNALASIHAVLRTAWLEAYNLR